MNFIWFFIIVLSILTAMLTGNTHLINTSILNSPVEAVAFCFKLMGNMCLWLGIMKIAEKANIIDQISKFFKPIVKRIFPDVPQGHPAFSAISMSLIANMMGIGNAATAFGIKAMKELQKLNAVKDTASNSMCMFIVANSFMIQLIHTNTLFIRSISGSTNPANVMPIITLATFVTLVCGIVITQFYQRLYSKREL
jgi:spore maturation protein A